MDVLMPQLGETVAEGKITQWFKAAGEQVLPGDNLFEIETDKVSMEVPSTTTGVLAEIRVQAGEVAPVGAIVAVIADGSGVQIRQPAAPAATSVAKPAAPATVTAAAAVAQAAQETRPIKLDPFFEVRTPERNFGPARLPGGVTVTPLARRIAAESGIDLSRINGSGPHGRIVAHDIERSSIVSPSLRALAQATVIAALQSEATAEQVKALYAPGSYEEIQLDGMRRTIAARLTQAIQNIPHFHLTADIAVDRLIALREEANAAAPKDKDGNPAFKLSLNDFIIRALALALQRVPAANAVWAGDRILRFKHSDIGVAVALDGGLITPVVRGAETKSVSTISAEMKELSARARDKKLKPSDYQGGSAAISNLGMYAVREFTAIINPPHATILAVGAARRQAVEKADGGVAFASVLALTLSCDHRVLDGAVGAELLGVIKSFLEMPVTMLV
jgi:pyruvate dehydrogenase E2 component (dihydrolipoyllysine-residue acetyltransferase)